MITATIRPRKASRLTAIASVEAPFNFCASVAIQDVSYPGACSLLSYQPACFQSKDLYKLNLIPLVMLSPRIPKIDLLMRTKNPAATPNPSMMKLYFLTSSMFTRTSGWLISGYITNRILAQKMPNTGKTHPAIAEKTKPKGMRI